MLWKRPYRKKFVLARKWASDHYIIGDAFEGMAELEPESFDFAEVDPPYGVDIDRRKSRSPQVDHLMEEYSEIDGDEFPAFFNAVAEGVYRALKPDTFAIFWYGMTWHETVSGYAAALWLWGARQSSHMGQTDRANSATRYHAGLEF